MLTKDPLSFMNVENAITNTPSIIEVVLSCSIGIEGKQCNNMTVLSILSYRVTSFNLNDESFIMHSLRYSQCEG